MSTAGLALLVLLAATATDCTRKAPDSEANDTKRSAPDSTGTASAKETPWCVGYWGYLRSGEGEIRLAIRLIRGRYELIISDAGSSWQFENVTLTGSKQRCYFVSSDLGSLDLRRSGSEGVILASASHSEIKDLRGWRYVRLRCSLGTEFSVTHDVCAIDD